MASVAGPEGQSENGANGADNQPTINLVSQYVKDMSVENPGAPESYSWGGQPEIDIQVNIGSRSINAEVHESELKVSATARHAEGVSFAVELSYCGLFAIRGVPADAQHHFLFAEAPRLIFPFARRILADAVRELTQVDGLQVHRSWWVAKIGVTDEKKSDGRSFLILPTGTEVPVSRSYRAKAKDVGLIR